jgi:hypothetical protein
MLFSLRRGDEFATQRLADDHGLWLLTLGRARLQLRVQISRQSNAQERGTSSQRHTSVRVV